MQENNDTQIQTNQGSYHRLRRELFILAFNFLNKNILDTKLYTLADIKNELKPKAFSDGESSYVKYTYEYDEALTMSIIMICSNINNNQSINIENVIGTLNLLPDSKNIESYAINSDYIYFVYKCLLRYLKSVPESNQNYNDTVNFIGKLELQLNSYALVEPSLEKKYSVLYSATLDADTVKSFLENNFHEPFNSLKTKVDKLSDNTLYIHLALRISAYIITIALIAVSIAMLADAFSIGYLSILGLEGLIIAPVTCYIGHDKTRIPTNISSTEKKANEKNYNNLVNIAKSEFPGSSIFLPIDNLTNDSPKPKPRTLLKYLQ